MLQAPFPWFGGKSRVAPQVWRAFGDVTNYVEPFFGSGAVLLGRPYGWTGTETVNDLDGYVGNFWRAVRSAPEAVAEYADWPVNENDQHARHLWLVRQRETLTARLCGDPDFYDAKIAGWCSGNGPWSVDESGQLVHLGNPGQGVNRQRVHLGDAGQGVNRKRVHLGDAGQGVNAGLVEWMRALADRLRHVRVCCGDWTRVCGPTPTVKLGLTGVFLDPPYSDDADRRDDLYRTDSGDVAHAVREWAVERGDDPRIRIVFCGYDGEHAMPDGWRSQAWKARGGYGSQGDGRGRTNAAREVLWFSPHCIPVERPWILAQAEAEEAAP